MSAEEHGRAVADLFSALMDKGPRAGDGPCQDCGGENVVWFAPNELWNRVVGGPYATGDPGGLLCPMCFVRRAESTGHRPTAWRLEPAPTTAEQAAGLVAANPRGIPWGPAAIHFCPVPECLDIWESEATCEHAELIP